MSKIIKFNITAKYIWGKIKQNIYFSHRALLHGGEVGAISHRLFTKQNNYILLYKWEF